MAFEQAVVFMVSLVAILSVINAEVHPHACQTKPNGDFPCDNGNLGVSCSNWKDGNDDCGDLSDELHFCETDTVGGRKTNQTFTCTNLEVIPCLYWNDGRRDCSDNSDEGSIYVCPSKWGNGAIKYQFKCQGNDLPDFSTSGCEPGDNTNDGDGDCTDGSDEQKFIGDECDERQPCDKFMPESYCNTTNQCDCKPGYKVIIRGADCAKRLLGDTCKTREDCWNSSTGMVCDDNYKNCTCEVGWKPNTEFPNATNCTIDTSWLETTQVSHNMVTTETSDILGTAEASDIDPTLPALHDTHCADAIDYCTSCETDEDEGVMCKSCGGDYDVSSTGKSCVECNIDENCETCKDDRTCATCKDHYELNETTGLCEEHDHHDDDDDSSSTMIQAGLAVLMAGLMGHLFAL